MTSLTLAMRATRAHACRMALDRALLALAVSLAMLVTSLPTRAGEPADDGWFGDDAAFAAESETDALHDDDEGNAGWADVEEADWDSDDANPRALTEFAPLLDPYGEWHNDTRYGLVWVPSRAIVGDDFAPYWSHGHWSLDTTGNWVWVSDFAFGPVVFHYGRWVWIPGVGWSWVPGYRYSPAWVVWRVPGAGVTYLGWAPMPPSYIWVDGVAVGVGFGVTTVWGFCPTRYVFARHPYRYRLRDRHRMGYLARHTHRYPHAGHRNGPTPRQAGVPKSQAPKYRVPAQPVPARAARPRAQRLPSDGSWVNSVDRSTPARVSRPVRPPAQPREIVRPRVQVNRNSTWPARLEPPRPRGDLPRPRATPPQQRPSSSSTQAPSRDQREAVSRRSPARDDASTSSSRRGAPVVRRARGAGGDRATVVPHVERRSVAPVQQRSVKPRSTSRAPVHVRGVAPRAAQRR